MVEQITSNLSLCEQGKLLTDSVKVSHKTDVYTNDVVKILSLSAMAVCSDSIVENTSVKFNGRVIFYLSYVDRENRVKKVEYSTEFSGRTELERDSERVDVFTYCKVGKVLSDKSQSTLSLSADVIVHNEVCFIGPISVVTGGTNLVTKAQELENLTLTGQGKCVYPIEEEFELPYLVKEVINQNVECVVTNSQSGVGCIIVDGQAIFNSIVLQNNQKGDIIKESRAFPFRVEIECENASPTSLSEVKERIRAFKLDVAVDEQKNTSLAKFYLSLEFYGACYERSAEEVVVDAYSLTNDVELKFSTAKFTYPLGRTYIEKDVSLTSNVLELPIGATVVAVNGISVIGETMEKSSSGITITGVLTGTLLIRNQDEYFKTGVEAPFSVKVETDDYTDASILYNLVFDDCSARIVTLTSVELSVKILIGIRASKTSEIQYVEQIIEGQEKRTNDCSISVYIPFAGEELFSLAKRLNQTPENLLKTNKDLCFPLTGNERIVVYRQI